MICLSTFNEKSGRRHKNQVECGIINLFHVDEKAVYLSFQTAEERKRKKEGQKRMKILSITAQKPHSTGSGVYLTELVKNWAEAGHEQSVVGGIYEEDQVDFPDGVKFYPVFLSHRGTSICNYGDV